MASTRFKITATIILWAPTKADAESLLHNIVEMDSDIEGIDVTDIEDFSEEE